MSATPADTTTFTMRTWTPVLDHRESVPATCALRRAASTQTGEEQPDGDARVPAAPRDSRSGCAENGARICRDPKPLEDKNGMSASLPLAA